VTNKQEDAGSDTAQFTSKVLVQQALMMMKGMIDNDNELTEIKTENSVDLEATVQELYGFNQRGQLQWQHWRSQLPNTRNRGYTPNKSMTVDVLQQYSPLRVQDMAFPNLPSDMQVPNASNSIDLREYSGELAEYYREGNGTTMGKMMFQLLPMYQSQLGAKLD